MGEEEVEAEVDKQRQEYLKAKYPGTHFPLGQFKDQPDYFKRKRKKEADNPQAQKLVKKLRRRGLPPSYLAPLLRLHLKPRALDERLQTLVDLRDRRKRIRRDTAAEVASINSTINQLLGKSKNHECDKPSAIAHITAHQFATPDLSDGPVHPAPPRLPGVWESGPGSIPDPGTGGTYVSNLLQPPAPCCSGSCPGKEDTQDPLVHPARSAHSGMVPDAATPPRAGIPLESGGRPGNS